MPADESGSLMLLSKDFKSFRKVYYHLSKEVFQIDNDERGLGDIVASPIQNYELIYKFKMGTDFFKPPASYLKEIKETYPWKQVPGSNPDPQRCFKINLKEEKNDKSLGTAHKYFCFEEYNGEPVNVEEGGVRAYMLVETMNQMMSMGLLVSSEAFCASCSEKPCVDTLTWHHILLSPIKADIRKLGIMVDDSCDISVAYGFVTPEECLKLKMDIIRNRVETSAKNNQKCKEELLECIEIGKCKISRGDDMANNDDSPFKSLDEENAYIPEPESDEPVDMSLMLPEQKEIEMLKEELGLPIQSASVSNAAVRPGIDDIQKAINTFKKEI